LTDCRALLIAKRQKRERRGKAVIGSKDTEIGFFWMENRALLTDCRARWTEEKGETRKYRGTLSGIEYRALLTDSRALLTDDRKR